jgi:hypothetical protein
MENAKKLAKELKDKYGVEKIEYFTAEEGYSLKVNDSQEVNTLSELGWRILHLIVILKDLRILVIKDYNTPEPSVEVNFEGIKIKYISTM